MKRSTEQKLALSPLGKASFILVVSLGLLILSGFLLQSCKQVNPVTSLYNYRDFLLDDEILSEATPLPESFSEECFNLNSFSEIKVSEGGSVVGLFSEEEESVIREKCKNDLLDRGWEVVESGQQEVASFIKGEGTYCWLLLSSSSVEEGSLLVVHIV